MHAHTHQSHSSLSSVSCLFIPRFIQFFIYFTLCFLMQIGSAAPRRTVGAAWDPECVRGSLYTCEEMFVWICVRVCVCVCVLDPVSNRAKVLICHQRAAWLSLSCQSSSPGDKHSASNATREAKMERARMRDRWGGKKNESRRDDWK